MTLFMMHREKWDLFNVAPLVLVYGVLWLYDEALPSLEYVMLFRLVVFAGVLMVAGLLMYPVIYQEQGNREIPYKVDWYSIIGFATLCSLYAVLAEALWTKTAARTANFTLLDMAAETHSICSGKMDCFRCKRLFAAAILCVTWKYTGSGYNRTGIVCFAMGGCRYCSEKSLR